MSLFKFLSYRSRGWGLLSCLRQDAKSGLILQSTQLLLSTKKIKTCFSSNFLKYFIILKILEQCMNLFLQLEFLHFISVFTSTSNAPTNAAPCILTHGWKEAEKGALVKEWNSRRWCPGSWEASEDRGMIGCDLPPLLALFKGAV